jgi:glycosyltransferase involved in cell wall biosynthesis
VRVLIVTDWYPAGPGDPAGSFVRAQAQAVGARHEVTVLHLDGRSGPLGVSVDGAVRTLRPSGGASPLPLTAANLRAVFAAVRRHGIAPELVHAHGFSAGLAGLALARARRVPLVVSEHSSVFSQGTAGRVGSVVARLVFARADVVCPVSESQRAVLEEAGYRGRFRVVPNPVDVELFSPAGEPPPPDRAVTVGSLRPVKGTGDLVEAVRLMQRSLSLDIVGEGPLRADLEGRVGELGLGERVTFAGALPPFDLAARLRGATFAVIPSRWETFSVALSEALACGLPVVATSVGGLPERVHPGNGLLCPPADPPRLAAALDRMIETQASYDRAAIAAETREVLAPAAVAARWDEMYGEAVALRRQPRQRS